MIYIELESIRGICRYTESKCSYVRTQYSYKYKYIRNQLTHTKENPKQQ